ncbi:MAG: DUF2125 domain-containing protein [Pseudolabrys sp.]
MPYESTIQSRRRTGRRYVVMLFLVFALIAGWSLFWKFAADRAAALIADWKAREAVIGRVYDCGSQSIAGYPFRIEVTCAPVSAEFRNFSPPLDIKLPRILVAAQIYQPTLLISEFAGPVSISSPGKPPEFEATWRLGQSSVSGLPSSPERVSLVFDGPELDHLADGKREVWLKAEHLELHGRRAEPSADGKAGIETALRLEKASIPAVHPAAAEPLDAVIDAVLRGVKDFAPKPWKERLRELQAAGGRIEVPQARVSQGDILAVGSGALTLNASGRLDGQIRVTIAGLEQFLDKIGAKQMVQTSPAMDKLAGALDRLAPGLGNAARQQLSENIGTGINALGEKTTLENRPAVTLPLRFDDGAMFLGPIPIGKMPPLF